MLLAGDIGGTNVRLDFYEEDGSAPIKHEARGKSGALRLPMTYGKGTILDALHDFANDFRNEVHSVKRACFGIAGKITKDEHGIAHVAMTNRLAEDVTDAQIGEALGAKVRLVNDMAAHIASVDVAPRTTLHEGIDEPTGVRAILMPGTGCGVGFAVWTGNDHQPTPSEGGHFEFPPRTDDQITVLKGLGTLLPAQRSIGRRTYESVLSGPGLENVYACLADPAQPKLVPGVDGRAITDAAAGRESPAEAELAGRTVRLFTEVLAQYASNLGMLLLPTSGIWIGGNIIDAIRKPDPAAFDKRFLDTFLDGGTTTVRGVLSEMPIHLLDPIDTGLLGAAQIAARM